MRYGNRTLWRYAFGSGSEQSATRSVSGKSRSLTIRTSSHPFAAIKRLVGRIGARGVAHGGAGPSARGSRRGVLCVGVAK